MTIYNYPETEYTVGVGGDYTDWTDAFTNITWADNSVKLVQISDITVTSTVPSISSIVKPKIWTDPGTGRVYVGTLTITSNKPHYGNFNGGWKTTINIGASSSTIFAIGGYSCRFRMYNMNFYTESSGGGLVVGLIPGIPDVSIDTQSKYIYNNCFNLNDNSEYAIFCGGNLISVTALKDTKIWNNKIAFTKAKIGGAAIFWREYPDGGGIPLIENNTIYGTIAAAGLYISDFPYDFKKTIKNNAIFSPTNASLPNFFFKTLDEAYNNISQDDTADDATTQSGNIINATAADEFVSLDSSSSDFLKPKEGGQIYNMGIAPSISENTTGIGGNARPWS